MYNTLWLPTCVGSETYCNAKSLITDYFTKVTFTVLHLVPHTTCRWLSHCEANTLLSRPRENSLSLRMPGSRPAAKPRRLRWRRTSCCCWGLNSRPRRAQTTERRLHHHCWAWRDEQDTRLRLCGAWHQPSCGKNGEKVKWLKIFGEKAKNVEISKWRDFRNSPELNFTYKWEGVSLQWS